MYELPNGSCPVESFLESLDRKMKMRMAKTIILLKENGPNLREPYSKYIGDGIFELRAKVGSDITHVLYFFLCGKRIILTNGFVKKDNRTPSREIEKCRKYRSDYKRRHLNEF